MESFKDACRHFPFLHIQRTLFVDGHSALHSFSRVDADGPSAPQTVEQLADTRIYLEHDGFQKIPASVLQLPDSSEVEEADWRRGTREGREMGGK